LPLHIYYYVNLLHYYIYIQKNLQDTVIISVHEGLDLSKWFRMEET